MIQLATYLIIRVINKSTGKCFE